MTEAVYILGRDTLPSYLRLGAGEALGLTLLCPVGVSDKVMIEVDLDGPGAELDLSGLYLCKETERLDIQVLVRHNSPLCTSRQLFKGIVGGQARASFDGLIYVASGAMKTKAKQENHSILLSDQAKVETRPQLEIYADDVECSHGATSGFLSEEELFYMRSRGIDEDQARRLQILSFISPISDRFSEEIKNCYIYANL